ncbi:MULTISPECIES: hypothetical protein [unclassified Thiocapsa]|uniref:hypothetical protein n=1 Tax=unclassified Thiocapsa TaxID=2641286 RepID=UPI0035B2280E
MTESAADCRPIPFILVFVIAALAILLGVYAVPESFSLAVFDAQAITKAAIYLGATMLMMCYVDAFRSRCLRGFVTIALVLLALGCAVPFFGSERALWGPLQHGAINSLYLLVGLLAFLHFSLHTMPSAWRQSLTPRRSDLIGAVLVLGVALYRDYDPSLGVAKNLVELGATGIAILVGALLCTLLMRHRARGLALV